MKYYKNAQQLIIEASHRDANEQCLFLVSDVGNKFDSHAVMLHNGRQKLGHVSSAECSEIRKFLDEESKKQGRDVVLIVHVNPLHRDGFYWQSSFNVSAVGIVYERYARKYSNRISS